MNNLTFEDLNTRRNTNSSNAF